MNRMKRNVLVLIVIFLAVVSLTVVSVHALQNKLEVIPLRVGNKWEFSESEFDKSRTLLKRETVFASVVEEKTIETKTWYKYREFGNDFWVRSGEGGQYEAVLDDFDQTSPNKDSEEILFFRYPVTKTPVKYKSQFGDMKVISRDAEVTANAGTFTCYHYQILESDLRIDIFVAPGKGLVKNRFEDETSVRIAELESFRLKREESVTVGANSDG